jgi:hypothetical protein
VVLVESKHSFQEVLVSHPGEIQRVVTDDNGGCHRSLAFAGSPCRGWDQPQTHEAL